VRGARPPTRRAPGKGLSARAGWPAPALSAAGARVRVEGRPRSGVDQCAEHCGGCSAPAPGSRAAATWAPKQRSAQRSAARGGPCATDGRPARRQISELWTQATEVETEPYAALANIDRIRYQSELEAYNYRCLGLSALPSVKPRLQGSPSQSNTVLCLQFLTQACFLWLTSLRAIMPLGIQLQLATPEWRSPMKKHTRSAPSSSCTPAMEYAEGQPASVGNLKLTCWGRRLATEAAAQQAAEAAQQVAGVQQATAQAANPIYLRPNEPPPPNGAPAAPAAGACASGDVAQSGSAWSPHVVKLLPSAPLGRGGPASYDTCLLVCAAV